MIREKVLPLRAVALEAVLRLTKSDSIYSFNVLLLNLIVHAVLA
jgi:hypothetical protein